MASDVHKAGEELLDGGCGWGILMPDVSPLLKSPRSEKLLDMALGDRDMDGGTIMDCLFGKNVSQVISPDA